MMSYIVRNQYGVHPDEETEVKNTVLEIEKQCRVMDLVSMSALEQAWVIGGLLKQLKSKVFKGQWMNFCRDHFKRMSYDVIGRYMLLASFKEELKQHFRVKGYLQLENPGETIKMLASPNSIPQIRGMPESNQSEESGKLVKVEVLPAKVPTMDDAIKVIREWTKHKNRNRGQRRTPREYCPHCGQLLSKRVKAWIKEHPGGLASIKSAYSM